MSKLIRLVSINQQTLFENNENIIKYYLLDCYINKNFIIKIKEDLMMLELFLSKKLPNIFPNDQKFTCISLSKGSASEELSVLGSTELIVRKFED